jgi:hypothetical protein
MPKITRKYGANAEIASNKVLKISYVLFYCYIDKNCEVKPP